MRRQRQTSRRGAEARREEQGIQTLRSLSAPLRLCAISAFTLLELMTVISIIVVVMALAVPVVNSLEGNRSVEAGYNKVAAALGHARQIALYFRTPAGVVFFEDPVTGKQDIGYVMSENALAQNYASSYNNVIGPAYLVADSRMVDLIPTEEITTFPQGVAVELINGDAQAFSSNAAAKETPIIPGTQTYPDAFIRVGVVLFDENGQLSPSSSYWISPASTLGATLGIKVGLGTPNGSTIAYGAPTGTLYPTTLSLYSSPALCIFDEGAYKNQISNANGGSGQPFNDGNNNSIVYYGNFVASTNWSGPSITYTYLNHQVLNLFPGQGYLTVNQVPGSAPSEIDQANEQTWLQQNAQIYAIKPDDGSLLKNQ